SRHYADVASMAMTPMKYSALSRLSLLRDVCVHKDYFYPSSWARYLDATPNGIHLLPRDARLESLSRDYEEMKPMFFQDQQSLESLLDQLRDLEAEIHNTSP